MSKTRGKMQKHNARSTCFYRKLLKRWILGGGASIYIYIYIHMYTCVFTACSHMSGPLRNEATGALSVPREAQGENPRCFSARARSPETGARSRAFGRYGRARATNSPPRPSVPPRTRRAPRIGHRLNGYFAQRVPSLFLASSFGMCLMCGVLEGVIISLED